MSLPVLPTVAAQLLELMDNEKNQEHILEHLVSNDPVLASRLLKMINAKGESVTSIHSAIGKLGIETVRDISMEASIASMSRGSEFKNAKVDMLKLGDHCSAVGIVARIIAVEYEPNLATDAFTAGLLHDIGKYISLWQMSKEFEQAIELSKSSKCELHIAEKKFMSTDHGQIGALYAENQRFPRSIVEVIQYHHDLSRAQINRPLVAFVAFADVLCRILEAGNGLNYAPPAFSDELANELGKWRINLELNALQPLMFKCIEELNNRNLTQYQG
jgi:putative nucleotidyltransferase with HDIG domain